SPPWGASAFPFPIQEDAIMATTQRTLAELFAAYEAEYLSDKAPQTRYSQHHFFQQVLRDLGNVPLDELTPDVLRAWRLGLDRRYKHTTVHRQMQRLEYVLKIAVTEFEWMPANPLAKIRKPSMGPGVVRFLSQEERVRLLEACRQSENPLLFPL